ncbi:FAD-dependent monooxygenase [Streptomyces sp. NPDC002073]
MTQDRDDRREQHRERDRHDRHDRFRQDEPHDRDERHAADTAHDQAAHGRARGAQEMTDRTAVLIVGAGPVGLATACALWQRGVPARIVEAQDGPQRGSRAVQLHAPTLRIFRELGILDEAGRRGLRIRSNQYHLAGGRTLKIGLGTLNEPLMLPQEITCELLEQRLTELGGRVERGVTVTKVAGYDDAVTVHADGPEGELRIEADWLVAADGVRSRVREQLGIGFEGADVPVTFLLAEGTVAGRPADDAVHYFLGLGGSVVFASMPGDRVRISAAVPPEHPLTRDGVQSLLDERGPGGLRIRSLDTVNNFSSQERIAARLRAGRVFLVGDAAHTHSPLGGQGLNLGLQDMHNLTWKLAGVVNGTLRAAVLDTYEPERRAAAEQIVANTHRFLKVFTLGPAAARVRNTVWGTLDAAGVLGRWFAPLLAGWQVRYPAGPAGGGRWTAPARRGLPAAGTRSARWAASPHEDDRFRLLTIGSAALAHVRAAEELAARHPGLLSHRHTGRGAPGFLLLRPDGYVAAGGATSAEWAELEALFAAVAP